VRHHDDRDDGREGSVRGVEREQRVEARIGLEAGIVGAKK
jgi:hypothetical protein